MPDRPPGTPIDALQAQLRQALDAQLTSFTQQYEDAIAEARRAATQEAEQAVETRIQAVELEWAGRLEAQLTAARTEAQRTLVTEVTKARVEAEQQAAESVAHVRTELEQAAAAERQRAESQLQAERQRLESQLQEERQRVESQLEEERQRAETLLQEERQRAESLAVSERQRAGEELEAARREARAATEKAEQAARGREQAEEQARTHATAHSAARAEVERLAEEQKRQPTGAGAVSVIEGIRAIDGARSLTEALDALLKHASSIAPRAVVFLVNGDRLRSWKSVGFPQFDAQPFESAIVGTGLLAKAIQSGEATASSQTQPPPTFAHVPGDLASFAVPILVGGRAVALVYADNAARSDAPESWCDGVETLARHGSVQLALLTAMRTVQAIGAGAPVGTGGAVAPDVDTHDQSARRYARLLVSEIKLYNEAAVRAGRQERDLLRRLRPEIDRARRLYEERIPAALGARSAYFQQELVQTLADGDPSLLGNA
jgi:hypothetical protein